MTDTGQLFRERVRVTWTATRRTPRIPWPDGVPGSAGCGVVPEPGAATGLWGAVIDRGEESGGLAFDCGVRLDDDGDEADAACRVVAGRVLALPGPWAGDPGTVIARLDLEAEKPHGANSFALGQELAGRLSGAVWEYTHGGAADLEVISVRVHADQRGWVQLHPPRPRTR